MKEKRSDNSMILVEYAVDMLIISYFYTMYIFRPLSFTGFPQSVIILSVLFLGLVIPAVNLTEDRYMNKGGRLAMMVFPFGIYTIAAYFDDLWLITVIMLALCAVMIFLFLRSEKKKDKRTYINALIASRNMLSLMFTILGVIVVAKYDIIPLIPVSHAGETKAVSAVSDNNDDEDGGYGIYYQKLAPLASDEYWKTLSHEDKLVVLQAAVDLSAEDLGIPYKLEVRYDDMEDDLYACYNHRLLRVTFNEREIDDMSADEVLFTSLHECYHSYQHCLVELLENADPKYGEIYFVKKAQVYSEEFANYIKGSEEDYYEYAGQMCETDADVYANYNLDMYKVFISEYVISHGSGSS